jgi:hypothetical protein
MKIRILSKFSLILTLVFLGTAHAGTPSIKVWVPDFSNNYTITESSEIESIALLWLSAEKVQTMKLPPLDKGLYKIDFTAALPTHNGRWLYHKSGYFRFLSKSQTQVFKVKEPAKLNELLKI